MRLFTSVCVFGIAPLEKSPVSVFYCSLVESNSQKEAYYIRRLVPGKKFGRIFLTGLGKRFQKLYYNKLSLVYRQCIMHAYRCAMLNAITCNCSANLQ